jgi:hypothetical protein
MAIMCLELDDLTQGDAASFAVYAIKDLIRVVCPKEMVATYVGYRTDSPMRSPTHAIDQGLLSRSNPSWRY